jgi:hypothetical protein
MGSMGKTVPTKRNGRENRPRPFESRVRIRREETVKLTPEQKAKERICGIRDYVIDADVLSVADLERMTGSLASATEAQSELFLKELQG